MRIEPDPLVETIAEHLRLDTDAPAKDRLDLGWQRLRTTLHAGGYVSRPPRRARFGLLRYALVGSMTVALAGFLTYRYLPASSDRPLQYQVQGTTLGPVGTMATRENASILFSDESRLFIDPDSQLRVLGTDAQGAHVSLESGAMEVSVKHRAKTSWRFDAGPFTVFVKGTAFHLGYEASKGRLDLHMRTGVVEVRGPQPDRVLTLHAGESLELFAKPPTPSMAAPSATIVEAVSPSEEPIAEQANPLDENLRPAVRKAHPRVLPRSAVKSPTLAMAPQAWSNLIAQGDFSAIVQAAEQQGLERVLAMASAADLSALSDAARYTRRFNIARQSLLATRARFAGSERSKDAAFFLGRLSENGPGAQDAAVTWYETYLREAPRGPYAAEAMGRELSLLGKQGSPRSGDLARRYLEQFPKGNHGELARSLLQ